MEKFHCEGLFMNKLHKFVYNILERNKKVRCSMSRSVGNFSFTLTVSSMRMDTETADLPSPPLPPPSSPVYGR